MVGCFHVCLLHPTPSQNQIFCDSNRTGMQYSPRYRLCPLNSTSTDNFAQGRTANPFPCFGNIKRDLIRNWAHLSTDFLIRSIIRTRLFNDYLGSLTNTPVIQRLLGCLTITAEQNATIRAKRTKPRRRIALQRGSLMCWNSRKALFQAVFGHRKSPP